MRCPCYYASPGERSFFYPLVLVAVISVTVQPGYNEIQCRYYPWQEPYLSLSFSLPPVVTCPYTVHVFTDLRVFKVVLSGQWSCQQNRDGDKVSVSIYPNR